MTDLEIEIKDSPYIVLDVRLAVKLGLNKAIVMRKLFGWIKYNIRAKNTKNFKEGRWWVYNSSRDWQIDMPFFGYVTIFRQLKALEEDGYVLTGCFNTKSWDKTVWYSIEWIKFLTDFPHFRELIDLKLPSGTPPVSECNDPFQSETPRSNLKQPVPERNDNTNEQNPTIKTQRSKPITTQDTVSNDTANFAFGELVCDGVSGQVVTDPTGIKCAIFFNGGKWTSPIAMLPNESLGSCYARTTNQGSQQGTALASKGKSRTDTTPQPAKAIKTAPRTWESNDPFAVAFGNMTKVSICKAKFDTEEYREYLTGLMETLNLTINEINQLTHQWQEYHVERTTQPKVAKSSFRTWVNNYVERRAKAPARSNYGRPVGPALSNVGCGDTMPDKYKGDDPFRKPF